jgi:uncharacterized protein YlxW (UPF0749 family)
MFNDSELKRIETNLAHIERDIQELRKAETLIRQHGADRMKSVERDMENDLARNHSNVQNKERELEKARNDRTSRQNKLQEEFSRANKH